MKNYLCIGKIAKPQGIHGEMKIQSFSDDVDRFMYLDTVWLDDTGNRFVEVKSARVGSGVAYLTLFGIDDRDKADALRDTYLYVDRKHAMPLPEGHHFVTDLIGLSVMDDAGRVLGRLDDILQAGGNDVYSVAGKRPFLFPALKKVIQSVDLAKGCMVLYAKPLAEVAVYDDED